MSNETFQFELVSPEKVLVSEQVKMAVVPGTEGDFGVLSGHAPLLSSIRPGVVTVTSPDGAQKKMFVAGGFADVGPALCTVLAQEAVGLDQLDRGRLEEQLRNLQDDLAFAKDDAARSAAIRRDIETTQAKIRAVA